MTVNNNKQQQTNSHLQESTDDSKQQQQQQQQATTNSHLQEPADDALVISLHGDHILVEPEEGTVVPWGWFSQVQNTIEIKEQTPSALCI